MKKHYKAVVFRKHLSIFSYKTQSSFYVNLTVQLSQLIFYSYEFSKLIWILGNIILN